MLCSTRDKAAHEDATRYAYAQSAGEGARPAREYSAAPHTLSTVNQRHG